jgi:ATP-dependent RNA helicase RhlE
MPFSSTGLRPELLNAMAGKGYTQPTPVQVEAIPAVLQGRDVLACAPTGFGQNRGVCPALAAKPATT